MSGFLEKMAEAHSLRMAVHSAMLAHLDLDPGAEDACLLTRELRGTLLSCARCRCPVTCAAWIEDGNTGCPPWCGAGSAFASLAAARARLKRGEPA